MPKKGNAKRQGGNRPSGGPMHFEPPLPTDSKEEIVGSIFATVLGAAESATGELGIGVPRTIQVVSDDGQVTIKMDARGAAVMLAKRTDPE